MRFESGSQLGLSDILMKTKPGKFVPFCTPFAVTVSSEVGKRRFVWEPNAVYITYDRSEINLHYAGKRAGESAAVFILPTSASFLKRLASALLELANEYPDSEA